MTISNYEKKIIAFTSKKDKIKKTLISQLRKGDPVEEISVDSDSAGNLWMSIKTFGGQYKKGLINKGKIYSDTTIIKKDKKYVIRFRDAYYSSGKNVLATAYLWGNKVDSLSEFGDTRAEALNSIRKHIMIYQNY